MVDGHQFHLRDDMNSIDFQIECAGCGAKLIGQYYDAACPICKRPIAHTLNLTHVDMATMMVKADLACRTCGYNLRCLPLRGVCPECSRPVLASLPPNPLDASDPRWLRRLRTGVVLVGSSSFVINAPTSIAGLIVPQTTGSVASFTFFGFSVILIVLWTIGMLLGTSGDPLRQRHAGTRSAALTSMRISTQIAVLIWPSIPLIYLTSAYLGTQAWSLLMRLNVGGAVFLTDRIAFAWAYVGFALYLRRLMKRDAKNGLRRLTSWWAGTAIVLTVLSLCPEDPMRYLLYRSLGTPAYDVVMDMSRPLLKVTSFIFWAVGLVVFIATYRMLTMGIGDRHSLKNGYIEIVI